MAAPASTCCDGAFCWRHDPRKVRKSHQNGSIPVNAYPVLCAIRTPSSTAWCVASIRRSVGFALSLASAMPSCILSISVVICSAKPDRRSYNSSTSPSSSAVQMARTRESLAAARPGGTPACRSLTREARSAAGERDVRGRLGKLIVSGCSELWCGKRLLCTRDGDGHAPHSLHPTGCPIHSTICFFGITAS